MKVEEMTREELLEFFGDVYRATCILLNDWPEEPADAAFFHARTHGDYEQLFELVADHYQAEMAHKVVVNGGDGRHIDDSVPGEAWTGANSWIEELRSRTVKIDDIYLTEPAFNTKEENDGFLAIAIKERWRSAIIVNQPHHLLRASLGLIRSMKSRSYWLRVYHMSPKSKPASSWWQKVYWPSAGVSVKNIPLESRFRERFDLMPAEFAKIPEYQAKGDLATFEDLFEYLKRRHTIR